MLHSHKKQIILILLCRYTFLPQHIVDYAKAAIRASQVALRRGFDREQRKKHVLVLCC